ncbi:MAG TPA: protein kinase [Thermoanaerobaculia bacterium]|nr:protein kinase [Thermoanaerobaculia bacterium]
MTELRRITERYRLDKLVHASDVASVFRAADRQTGEPVAVKLFSGIDDDPARQREPFSRVTRALQEVRHAAIPRVLDFGFAKGGDAFLVTEFIPGTRLSVLGGSPPERVIALLLPVVSGLEALAERGVYHRNLSADNLLVSPGDRSGEQVKVLGWGKAVLRLAGESWRTDLRALAELACQVMEAPVTGEPEAPRVEVPPTDHADSGALRRLLESCLSSDHQDAPASYAELGAALRHALRGEGETADSTNPALGGISQAGATTASSAASSRAATAATETGALEATRSSDPGDPSAEATLGPSRMFDPPEGDETTRPFGLSYSPATEATSLPESELHTLADGQASAKFRTETLPVFTPEDLDGGTSRPAAAAVSRAAAAAPGPPRLPRRRVVLLACGLAVALAAVLLMRLRSPLQPPGPAPGPAARAPAPRPAPARPSAAPAAPSRTGLELSVAAELLGSGDLEGAARALTRLSSAEQQAAFSPAERDRYQRLSADLEAARRKRLADDLADGLRTGDRRRLGAAIAAPAATAAITAVQRHLPDSAAAPGRQRGGLPDRLPAALRRDLARAQRILELDTLAARAQRAGNDEDLLRLSGELLALLPRDARASELRERAAAAREAGAAAALEAGRPDTALAQLDLLRRAWPERPGLAERIERAEGMRRSEERMDSVLAAAARAEAAGQPLEGLELLAGTVPASRYKERFAGQRLRLEELLARLDAAPPVIALRGGFKLEFEKDKPATIPLRVTDDLAVKTVECWARPEGGRYQPLAVRHLAAADYEVGVPRELHQNRNVDFYAVATDPSGHRAALGSREKPLKLKRKGWLSRLFGGKGEG